MRASLENRSAHRSQHPVQVWKTGVTWWLVPGSSSSTRRATDS